MKQNIDEPTYFQEDEIDLRQLLVSIVSRKKFIVGFTGIVTALAVLYALRITPTYEAEISFLSPSDSSIIELNRVELNSETKQTILREFLNKFMSNQFQRKVFDENDYLAKLNPKNEPIDNVGNFFNGFSKSINIEVNKVEKDVEIINYEKPIRVTIEGSAADAMSSFLNKLASSANKEVVDELLNTTQQKIDIRLEEIDKQKGLLLSGAKQERLNKIAIINEQDNQKINEINDEIERLLTKAEKDRLNKIDIIKEQDNQKINEINDEIERLLTKAEKDRLNKIDIIKEQDNQKINEINDKIERLRVKAKKDRLNRIQVLTDAAILAKELGIKENNFKKFNSDNLSSSTLIVSIDDNQKVPDWYLYGEDALIQRVDILSNIENDDPYVPEIVNLQNQLKEIYSNQTLKTLENRADDSPFIEEIVNLQKQLKAISSNQTLKTLENRADDSPFIEEIVNLQKQLKAISSNQTLKTLENRADDSPFIKEISALDIEAIRLKSYKLSPTGISAVQVNQQSFTPVTPIKPNKRLIVVVAAVAGFILSIFLVLLMNAFRSEDEKVAV